MVSATSYAIVGEIERCGIFREIEPDLGVPVGPAALLETAAEKISRMQHRVGPGKHDAALLAMTEEEVVNGFASGIYAKEDLDALFGTDQWRPLERFARCRG